ncbi:hypothetical protein FRC04_010294 [Tulasnella sp. 424]|nr:hypothetical protein FRC04_010294 [Tulasnella sp. 424]
MFPSRKSSTPSVSTIGLLSASSSIKAKFKAAEESSSTSIPATPNSTFSLSFPSTPAAEQGFSFTKDELKDISAPAAPSGDYARSQALEDLPAIRHALHTFLRGQMSEAEKYCNERDPHKERMYMTAGLGLIQMLKGLLSFEPVDIEHALESVRHASLVASQHRRPSSLTTRISSLVISENSGVGWIKGMTPVERHAELVYSECLLEKAVLGIVSSGDWITFIREFLNIRSATNTYRTLEEFIQLADKEAVARGEGPIDTTIDLDFRSGVALGVGINGLCLTLLPNSVSSVIAMFGYKAERFEALRTLAAPGGWSSNVWPEAIDLSSDTNSVKSFKQKKDVSQPAISQEDEGLRRPCTDLTLLIFHLFISSFTYSGVDIEQARAIVNYNLTLYPEGVFFLFLKGRLHVMESRPRLAIASYEKGMDLTGADYKNLKGVAQWELGLCQLALRDFASALPYWKAQAEEANWSKAVYRYGLAATLYDLATTEKDQSDAKKHMKEAIKWFEQVPGSMKKIAGKHIPVEKFVSRKSKKFLSQGNRLLHPTLEFCYMVGGMSHTPRTVFVSTIIPSLTQSLSTLASHSSKPSSYGNGTGYWDDYALAQLLNGACHRYVAYPNQDAIETEEEKKLVEATISKEAASKKAEESLKWVVENGTKIELDHQLVYTAHLELGRLYSCFGDIEGARRELELVNSGKPLEVNAAGRKGKYSLQVRVAVVD